LSAGRLRVQVPSGPPVPTAESPPKEGAFRIPKLRRAAMPPEESCRMVSK
jgi:hypothetical protein